jgi:hypothetical protein
MQTVTEYALLPGLPVSQPGASGVVAETEPEAGEWFPVASKASTV